MNTRLSVMETMDRAPLFAGPETSVVEAARMMSERDVGSMLVYEGDQLAGILTERDILAKVVAEGRDAGATHLATIMSKDVLTLGADATVPEALRLMRRHRIRHLPILDGEQKVAGLLTERLVAAVAPELIEVSDDWHEIAHNGDVGLKDIITEEETTGPCEGCDNEEVALRALDGRVLCEDCAEGVDSLADDTPTLNESVA